MHVFTYRAPTRLEMAGWGSEPAGGEGHGGCYDNFVIVFDRYCFVCTTIVPTFVQYIVCTVYASMIHCYFCVHVHYALFDQPLTSQGPNGVAKGGVWRLEPGEDGTHGACLGVPQTGKD